MIQNPSEASFPDGIYTQITIKAKLISEDTWEIYCPEWNCVFHDHNLTQGVAKLTSEIETHNNINQKE